MINVDNLKLGDTIYHVSEVYNFDRQLITMTDDFGYIWHRYDKDRLTYTISAMILVGRVVPVIEGEVLLDEDRYVELHFKLEDGQIDNLPIYDIQDNETMFHTKQEADKYLEELQTSDD